MSPKIQYKQFWAISTKTDCAFLFCEVKTTHFLCTAACCHFKFSRKSTCRSDTSVIQKCEKIYPHKESELEISRLFDCEWDILWLLCYCVALVASFRIGVGPVYVPKAKRGIDVAALLSFSTFFNYKMLKC